MKCCTPEAYQLLHQGSLALAQIERAGIRIDVGYLDQAIENTEHKISELESEMKESKFFKVWKKTFGEKANLGSGQQLGTILFDKMDYPCLVKTSTGRPATDAATLEKIDHPFVKSWMQTQKLKKTKNTFLNGIKREVVDGFIHPFINLHTVETYRSSGSDPNPQNWPIRDPEFASIVRRCFIPRKGRVLVEVDFGALEFLVASSFYQDARMLEYASNPAKDIHRDMAVKIWKCKKGQISKNLRYFAKNQFVFPEIYGSFYIKMAKALWEAIDEHKLTVGDIPMKEWLKSKGIDRLGDCEAGSEAKQGTFELHIKKIERDFNENMFPEFGTKKDEWWRAYKKTGSFRTMTGFVIQGVYSRNFILNAPIQSCGFHILLLSLILLLKEIRKRKMRSLVISEIHDCVLGDIPIVELQDYLNLIKRVMTKDVPKQWSWILTPLKVEVDVTPVGGSWHDKKKWTEIDGTWKPEKE